MTTTDLPIVSRRNAHGREMFYLGDRPQGYAPELAARNALREVNRDAERRRGSAEAPALVTEILDPVGGSVRHDYPGLDPHAYWVRLAGTTKWNGPFVERGEADAFVKNA